METKKKIIFLVDDDMTNLKKGKLVLTDTYDVYTIASGVLMFEMLKKVKPDLILLDISMPEMDGYEAISRLKENQDTVGIPVIFLTARKDEEDELEGLSSGAVDYISKPYTPSVLLKRIELRLGVEEEKGQLESERKELLKSQKALTKQVEDKHNMAVALKNALIENFKR